ncbi:DUF4258 domain-containing protein [Frigoribacterium salinisoli]
MKYIHLTLGVVVTGALVLTGVNPASAAETVARADAIQSATKAQEPVPDQSRTETLTLELELSGGTVSAPSGVGTDVQIAMPGDALQSYQKDDLSLDVSGEEGYTTALQDTGNGTFRALIHIESSSAPTEYTFDMGEEVALVPLEDGGITVWDSEGTMLGFFEPAWAIDAAGHAVPTSYEVRGTSIVQHVHFASTTAFPVVADPFWIPALLVMARLSTHVATRAAQRGVSQALIRQVVQNGKKTKGNGNTSVFTQGSGKNKIRVVVNNANGTIITVTKG